MYDDQAAELRNLIHQAGIRNNDSNVPRLIVVVGGKERVGTSTIASNLAAVVARQSGRVVLVDADPRGGDLRRCCLPKAASDANIDDQQRFIDARSSAADPMAPLIDVVAGLKLLVAPWAAGSRAAGGSVVGSDVVGNGVAGGDDQPTASHALAEIDRFGNHLAEMSDHAEYVIVDAGNGVSAVAQSLWTVSDVALVATTPDSVSVMECYAVIKSMLKSRQPTQITAVVNQSANSNVAADVFRRLDQSCQRFLGQTLAYGGAIPPDPLLANSGDDSTFFASRTPNSPAIRALEQVIRQMKSTFAKASRRSA